MTDSILLFDASVFESGKALSYDVEEEIHVVGDAPALSQLLEILLDNAVKYSPEGGTIALRLETAGRNAKLSVSNTGQPIPEQDLPHIFERFYRGDPSRQSTGGHGLGLAIARSIVEVHKGKIWAECRNGLVIFTVSLPCEKNSRKIGYKFYVHSQKVHLFSTISQSSFGMLAVSRLTN